MKLSERTLGLLEEYNQAIKSLRRLYGDISTSIKEDTDDKVEIIGGPMVRKELHVYSFYGLNKISEVADEGSLRCTEKDEEAAYYELTINGVKCIACELGGTNYGK